MGSQINPYAFLTAFLRMPWTALAVAWQPQFCLFRACRQGSVFSPTPMQLSTIVQERPPGWSSSAPIERTRAICRTTVRHHAAGRLVVICETCQGAGRVWRDSLPIIGALPGDPQTPPPGFSLKVPCPECGGSGVAHCCDGLQAKPDDPHRSRRGRRERARGEKRRIGR